MYEILVFLSIGFISGILTWFKRYGIEIFIFLILLLPAGNFMASYFYKGGLYFFDFYFASLIIRLVGKQKLNGTYSLMASGFLAIYAIWAVLQSQSIDKYFLRDLRLIIHLIYIISLLTIFTKIKLEPRSIMFMAITASLSCLFYSQLLTSQTFFSLEDQYYIENSYRFFSVASYFCFGFIAFNSLMPEEAKRGYLNNLALILCIMGVVLTGMRMLLLVAILTYILGQRGLRSRMILTIAIIISTVASLILEYPSSSDLKLVSRLIDMDTDTITYAFATRFLPAIELISEFDTVNMIFGGGFGTVFEIPWFDYRESLDSLNNFVDSTYLTLFGKFGSLSVLLLLVYFISYRRLLGGGNYFSAITLGSAISLLWLVYAVPYQMASIGLLLVMGLIGTCNTSISPHSKYKD